MPCVDGLDESSKARVLILKWKTDGLATTLSLALKSGTVCTVLLGTQFSHSRSRIKNVFSGWRGARGILLEEILFMSGFDREKSCRADF